MRAVAALSLLVVLVLTPAVAPAEQIAPSVALVDAFHTLDGRTITIGGVLRNTGTTPLRGLIIDANGYGPDGFLVASGTDGIPWQLAPGALERFSMSLPLGPQLVREYLVQVSLPGLSRPLSVARRTIDIELYRQHVRTLIQVEGNTRNGLLVVRADAEGLPVSLVMVRASLWALDPLIDHFRLVTLDFDVQPDSSKTVFVSTTQAILVSLQIVDIRLRANWN
ncbi:MAG TPA: hypothetical protein VI007_03880 [bacterium]